MKLKQLIDAESALHKLMNTPLPAAVAFRLKRVVRVVQPELQAYEEQRLALVHDLGEKGEDGCTIVTPANLPAFNKQIQALFDVDVELNFKPLTIADLGDTAVTAAELMALDWLFEEAK